MKFEVMIVLWLLAYFLDWFGCVFFNFCRERELQKTVKFRKRPPLRRGRVSPRLPVPDDIPKPPYLGSNELPDISSEHQIHDSEGIVKMRAACELAARVLDNAGKLVRVSRSSLMFYVFVLFRCLYFFVLVDFE